MESLGMWIAFGWFATGMAAQDLPRADTLSQPCEGATG